MRYLGITLGQKVYLAMTMVQLSISFGPKDIPRYTTGMDRDIAVWDNSVYLGLSRYISVYLGVTFGISRYT